MELANWVYCKLFGDKVAEDELGNVFYESKKMGRYFGRHKRWVYYNGIVEPTKISAAWYSWLHYQTDAAPYPKAKFYRWQKSRKPNLTGTALTYYPEGHALSTSCKPLSTGDYSAWQPKI
jgi:NADH:ubiquinone oxidoreductase subunit